ncbi:hypothetical protein, partial [Hwanghaeella sp. LZ110]|uniref:hypothetical protein n=1 Tax=Hwanghaeella sp. LZ110 TaxID=3402810 RepID=UPI003B67BD16
QLITTVAGSLSLEIFDTEGSVTLDHSHSITAFFLIFLCNDRTEFIRFESTEVNMFSICSYSICITILDALYAVSYRRLEMTLKIC